MVSAVHSGQWRPQWSVASTVVSDVHSGQWRPQWSVASTVVSAVHSGQSVHSGQCRPQWPVASTVVSAVHSGQYRPQWSVVSTVVSAVHSGQWCPQWSAPSTVVSGAHSGALLEGTLPAPLPHTRRAPLIGCGGDGGAPRRASDAVATPQRESVALSRRHVHYAHWVRSLGHRLVAHWR